MWLCIILAGPVNHARQARMYIRITTHTHVQYMYTSEQSMYNNCVHTHTHTNL